MVKPVSWNLVCGKLRLASMCSIALSYEQTLATFYESSKNRK